MPDFHILVHGHVQDVHRLAAEHRHRRLAFIGGRYPHRIFVAQIDQSHDVPLRGNLGQGLPCRPDPLRGLLIHLCEDAGVIFSGKAILTGAIPGFLAIFRILPLFRGLSAVRGLDIPGWLAVIGVLAVSRGLAAAGILAVSGILAIAGILAVSRVLAVIRILAAGILVVSCGLAVARILAAGILAVSRGLAIACILAVSCGLAVAGILAVSRILAVACILAVSRGLATAGILVVSHGLAVAGILSIARVLAVSHILTVARILATGIPVVSHILSAVRFPGLPARLPVLPQRILPGLLRRPCHRHRPACIRAQQSRYGQNPAYVSSIFFHLYSYLTAKADTQLF